VSNGNPVAHTLRFTWDSRAITADYGDTVAVRLGGNSVFDLYPGTPPATRSRTATS